MGCVAGEMVMAELVAQSDGAWVAISGVLGIAAIIIANAVYQSSRARRMQEERERAARAEAQKQAANQEQVALVVVYCLQLLPYQQETASHQQ